MKFWISPCLAICIALALAGCNGGSSSSLSAANQGPVVTDLTAQVVSGNAVTLTAIATDDVGITGYCFKTVNTAPLASDACFQISAQKNGAVLLPGVTYYVWAKDAADNVSASFKGPCSIAGYAASDSSSKNTVCMLTDKGEIVLELDAANAPITVANFLQYVNDGFYSGITFHRVIPTSLIQGGGYTYTSATSYQLKTPTYGAIVLERTSTTGLSNLRGTIAMARLSSVADSATSQFFINTANNNFLDAALQADGNGYAVFGKMISGLNVADLIKSVPFETGSAGTNQPITPIFIQWAYQLK